MWRFFALKLGGSGYVTGTLQKPMGVQLPAVYEFIHNFCKPHMLACWNLLGWSTATVRSREKWTLRTCWWERHCTTPKFGDSPPPVFKRRVIADPTHKWIPCKVCSKSSEEFLNKATTPFASSVLMFLLLTFGRPSHLIISLTTFWAFLYIHCVHTTPLCSASKKKGLEDLGKNRQYRTQPNKMTLFSAPLIGFGSSNNHAAIESF